MRQPPQISRTNPPTPAAPAIPTCVTASAGHQQRNQLMRKDLLGRSKTQSHPALQPPSCCSPDDVPEGPSASSRDTTQTCHPGCFPCPSGHRRSLGLLCPAQPPCSSGELLSLGRGHRERREPPQQTCATISPEWRSVPSSLWRHGRCPVIFAGPEDGTHVIAEGLTPVETPKLGIS